MGKDKEALQRLPKAFTRDDLFHAIAETARAAARETVSEMEEASKRNARRSDPGKAAQRMLSEYRRLKIAVKENIEISEAEGLEMRWQYLKDLMGTPDHALLTEEAAYARERRLQYNQYKIRRIEAAMAMYLRECENSGSEEAMRRYRVVKMRYMDDVETPVEEIAELESVSVKSVYNDVQVACKVIAVYLSAV